MNQPRDQAHDPFGAAGRAHRRQRKLGKDARCMLCGVEDLRTLSRQRVRQSQLEEHHVFGRQHDPYVTVTLCRNCHAAVSARQVDAGVRLTSLPNILEWLIAMVDGAGESLPIIGERLREWAAAARTLLDGLDRDYPGWRDKPWARR